MRLHSIVCVYIYVPAELQDADLLVLSRLRHFLPCCCISPENSLFFFSQQHSTGLPSIAFSFWHLSKYVVEMHSFWYSFNFWQWNHPEENRTQHYCLLGSLWVTSATASKIPSGQRKQLLPGTTANIQLWEHWQLHKSTWPQLSAVGNRPTSCVLSTKSPTGGSTTK